MVNHPSEYKWTSYMCDAYGEVNRLICTHETYSRLGLSEEARQQVYASLFELLWMKKKYKLSVML